MISNRISEDAMKPRKKPKNPRKQEQTARQPSPRNRALAIPLDFETAVEGLLSVKPQKKRPEK
jgi:hypothetical protein